MTGGGAGPDVPSPDAPGPDAPGPDATTEEIRADIVAARTEVARTVDQLADRLSPKNHVRRASDSVVRSTKESVGRAAATGRHVYHRVRSDRGVLIGSGQPSPALPLLPAGVVAGLVVVLVVWRWRR